MTGRFALVIGNSQYDDQTLSQLKTPDADVHTLAAALRDPLVGGFDAVEELINNTESAVRRAISAFYLQKKSDDLLLLYFSGHGVLDSQGRLFLAVKDTQRELLTATAIPASFISDDMDSCRSKRQILILDCCHSGAFARGAKGDSPAVTQSTFEGNGFGRVVLTASDSTQYALEGDQVIQQASLSLFTHYLLEGLTTGEADSAQDGWITLDEWYDYAYDRVISETPEQTPRKWVYNQQGDLVIAHNPRPKAPEASDLPAELKQAVESPFVGVRADAVVELSRLLQGKNPQQTLAAKEALQKLADHDDSRRIAGDAAAILAEYLQTHPVGVPSAPLETAPEPAELDQSSLPAAAVAGVAAAAKLASAEAAVAQVTPAQAAAGQVATGQAAAGLAAAGHQPALESASQAAGLGDTGPVSSQRALPGEPAGGFDFKALKRYWPVIPIAFLLLFCLSGYGAYRGLVIPYLAASREAATANALLAMTGETPTDAPTQAEAPTDTPPPDGVITEAVSTQLVEPGVDTPTPPPDVYEFPALVYSSNRNGNWDIFLMNLDTKEEVVWVADSSDDDSRPVFSPDGSKILFHSNRDGNYNLYTVTPSGSDLTQLTDSPQADTYGSWSPDGSQIVFQTKRNGNKEIYVMNADGSDQTRLTENDVDDQYPVWSPNGDHILYCEEVKVDDLTSIFELFIMNTDGSDQRQLTFGPESYAFPAWSPDNSHIAVEYITSDKDEIVLGELHDDGSFSSTGLTDYLGQSTQPSWSPDSTQIYFASNKDGKFQIYSVDLNGNLSQFTNTDAADEEEPSAAAKVSLGG